VSGLAADRPGDFRYTVAMVEMLAEQPIPTAVMLAAIGLALVYGYAQTGKKAAAGIGCVFLLLVPITFAIAEAWETDREQVEALIYRTADAVERNDVDAAVRIIGDEQVRAMAVNELNRFEFHVADVHRIRRIDIIEDAFPTEADVDLSVKVDVSGRGIQRVRVPRRLLLRLQKRDDDWFVIEYQHLPLIGGPDNFSNNTIIR